MSAGNVSSVVAYAAANLPDSATVCKSLESISLMGAAVAPALRTEIEQRVCSHLQIFYGSTEAGFVSEASASMLTKHPAATGRILPWVQAQAVDEDDNLLPIGKRGVLRFKTPSMADGYVQDARNTARAFRDGWFYPGDMGSIDVAGNMTLAGRVDLLLNVGGNKVNPEAIEEQLNKYPAILESAVVLLTRDEGMPTLVALVVQNTSIDMNDLMRWCIEHLPRNMVPTQVVVVPELLKNAAGKLMRAEMTKATRWSQADVPNGAETRH
jgi:acyl-coenzyme A synthetase/AMP-(fatty) acid ligase